MWRATFRGILARKVRLLLTALAVILGVAFVSGTFVLTDTLKASFGEVSNQYARGSDILITSLRGGFSTSNFGFGSNSSSIEASALPIIAGTPGVEAVSGIIATDSAVLIGRDGKPIGNGFNSQVQAISWPTANAGPFSLRSGRAPQAADEIVLDNATADQNGYVIGDTIDISVRGAAKAPYRIVGLGGLGGATDLGGLKIVGFDLATAQQLFSKPGQFDVFFVRLASGSDVTAATRTLQAELGPMIAVIDTKAFARAQVEQSDDVFGTINRFVLAFAALGVFVGGFIIANTFVILVQQRTRELALLRALGASGGQVRRSVLAEAGLLGLFASLVGFVVGIGFGFGLLRLLTGVGLQVPDVAPVVQTRTFIWSVVIGMAVTMISAIWPANRAAKTAPMAAIADVRPRPSKPFLRPQPLDPEPVTRAAVLRRLGFGVLGALAAIALGVFALRGSALTSWTTTRAGAALWAAVWLALLALAAFSVPLGRFLFSRLTVTIEFLALGFAYVAAGIYGSFPNDTDGIAITGIGCLTVFIGVVIGTALVARPIARVLGTRPVGVLAGIVGVVVAGLGVWELASTARSIGAVLTAAATVLAGFALAIAGPALFGTVGKLARGNAMRNPRRTATTASAVVIGMALIGVVAVFTASIQGNTKGAILNTVQSNYVLRADGYAGFSPTVLAEVQALPATRSAVALSYIEAETNGDERSIVGVNLDGIDDALALNFTAGSIDGLAGGGIALSDSRAADLKAKVGDVVTLKGRGDVTFPAKVVGIYTDAGFTGQQPAFAMVDKPIVDRLAGRVALVNQIFVRAKDGQVGALNRQFEPVLANYPTVEVRTKQEFLDESLGFLGRILNIFVGLLLFSLVIALLGIINTLLLSVYERTRELGLLRAIGTSRLQIRRMIRGEAVIIAVLGSVVGLAMGLFWGRVIVASFGDASFTTFVIPWAQLGAFTALSAAAAMLAAVIPAWRAGQLNVLEAIATE